MIAPPPPRPSAVVDPRIGDLGPALLALEDGTVFPGIAFGAPVAAGGDLVVNTSQTGYQEVCTDPSYAGQVVVMTYPLIGNYGRLARRRPVGPAVAARPRRRQRDGRRPRRRPPARGAAAGERHPGDRRRRHPGARPPPARERLPPRRRSPSRARSTGRPPSRAARAVPRWEDQDFVGQVSPAVGHRASARRATAARSSRSSTSASRRTSSAASAGAACGSASCPTPRDAGDGPRARTSPASSSRPGPGDPARLDGPVALARAVIDDGRPLLGICLGHQIVGRAAGAETRRLRFGHHGANHPVRDVDTGLVQVTAQNHEVQVVGDSLPAASGFHVSQVNLNDGSVEGLRHASLPIETVQYHPEGAPGPARRPRRLRPLRRRARAARRSARASAR